MIAILGGGPAGLAAAYYCQLNHLDYILLEASENLGGNCRTLNHEGFLFDTGAHRFHNKDKQTTELVKKLLGNELKEVSSPSHIYSEGRMIDFPLSPANLFSNLSIGEVLKAVKEITMERLRRQIGKDFSGQTIKRYGPTLSKRFILNYSKKLWGADPSELSPDVAGGRLKGLNVRTFFKELISGKQAKTKHLDGTFYYPLYGIGQIFEKLEEQLEPGRIKRNSIVTGIKKQDDKIAAVQINNETWMECDHVISSIPITYLTSLLEIHATTKDINFRQVVLFCFIINKPSISSDATIYFPSENYIFTRGYEPKNRSHKMSPAGKTSFILEVPCSVDDDIYLKPEDHSGTIMKQIISTGLFTSSEITNSFTVKLKNAYPVLTHKATDQIHSIQNNLGEFKNLHLTGRIGKFAYSHIHDHFISARTTIQKIISK